MKNFPFNYFLLLLLPLCVCWRPAPPGNPVCEEIQIADTVFNKNKVVVIENFDKYSSNQQLAKTWYYPGHGGAIIQTLDSITKAGGKYSLRFAYTNTPSADKFYSPICRVAKWDLSGTNAVQFWFKPDGSGREMTFQFNIANSKGNNIHDLWEYKFLLAEGDTAARYIVLPYSDLKHNTKYKDSPDVSDVFLPGSVIEVAMYIGGKNDKPGSGSYYFDEIMGITK
jgi:hypothetical protein